MVGSGPLASFFRQEGANSSLEETLSECWFDTGIFSHRSSTGLPPSEQSSWLKAGRRLGESRQGCCPRVCEDPPTHFNTQAGDGARGEIDSGSSTEWARAGTGGQDPQCAVPQRTGPMPPCSPEAADPLGPRPCTSRLVPQPIGPSRPSIPEPWPMGDAPSRGHVTRLRAGSIRDKRGLTA